MARIIRRQRQIAPISELNLTNLIDLGFTLLIIFMIATPLIHQEQAIQVNLPTESSRAQVKPERNLTFQSVSINREGQYFWGNRQVSVPELSSLLANEANLPEPAVIRIRADATVPYQKVISLVDVIKQHHLTKITFDTQTNQ